MRLYRNNEGVWVGTQAEAHNKNVIEVPVDKPGLLEWLNENVRSFRGAASEGQDGGADTDGLRQGDESVAPEAASDSEPLRPVDAGGTVSELEHRLGRTPCPKCRLTPKAAQRIADGITVDAICDKIGNSWGFELSRMAEAVTFRLQELVKALKNPEKL